MKNEIKDKIRILVAEDEKAYSRALVFKLQKNGFDAESAGDGEEALSILAQKEFDLLILDLIMPKINGFVVLEELQKNKNTMPVIVLSNLNQQEDIKKVEGLGAKMCIEKSNTSISDIIKIVESMVK